MTRTRRRTAIRVAMSEAGVTLAGIRFWAALTDCLLQKRAKKLLSDSLR